MPRLTSCAELILAALICSTLFFIGAPRLRQARGAADFAQTKDDLRTYSRALESYFIDHAAYPGCHQLGAGNPLGDQPPSSEPRVLERLTTPVAYMADSRLPTPFGATHRIGRASAADTANEHFPVPISNADPAYQSYWYQAGSETDRFLELNSSGSPATNTFSEEANKWILHAPGPDQLIYNMGGVLLNSSGDPGSVGSRFEDCLGLVYDPTNGTGSFGNVWSAGGQVDSFWGKQMFKAARAPQIEDAPSYWSVR